MATALTPRGYRYPDTMVGTPNNPPLHIQQLAEDVDQDVEGLDLRLSRPETGPIDVPVSVQAYTADSAIATADEIEPAGFDRVVEIEVVLNSSGVSSGTAWRTVLTRSTTGITTDVEVRVNWHFAASSAVGGVCAFYVTYDLPQGESTRPRLWLDELTDGGTLTLAGDQRFRIRLRPKGFPA